jgi:hypothetical protein
MYYKNQKQLCIPISLISPCPCPHVLMSLDKRDNINKTIKKKEPLAVKFREEVYGMA